MKLVDLTYTYWKDGDFFVGFLNDYPEDSTQGETLEELEDALREVFEIRREEKKHLSEIRYA
jgi:predicted RNase H-like HicB family nuclease